MNVSFRKAFTYDDVLLVPKRSDIASRSEVNLNTRIGNVFLDIPIVSANMKTVTGIEMACEISRLGGLPILHRFDSADKIIKDISKHREGVVRGKLKNIGVSVGIGEKAIEDFRVYHDFGIETFCIDVAHGHHTNVLKMIEHIRKIAGNTGTIIAGNVATGLGAKELRNAGANVIKVGCGPGSLCSTRVETGNGVPQLTALMDVADALEGYGFIIADGGIRRSGDIVKALVFADAVMLGNMLAGTNEAPGELDETGQYKSYVGSSTHKTNHIEGVEALVRTKGPVADVIQKTIEGIKSGLSYQGARNIRELREDVEFVEVTNASLIESKPHDVIL